MADCRTFLRATTVCLLAILVLPKVAGIRTGDHVATNRNLYELLTEYGLTSFLELVIKAEIQNTFTVNEEITVFAFNNTAFNILPNERKDAIRAKNRKETEDYVKFHTVYKHRILAENIQDNRKLQSNGPNQNILFTNKKRVQVGIHYDKTEQLFINGARIIKRDIYASNGILHIIDRALEITSNKLAVPYLDDPDDPRVKAKQFSQLIYHSLARDELRNEDKITFFVPTDEAMSRVNQEKLDQLKQNQQSLKEMILKHRVSNQVIFTSTVEFGTQWTPNSNIPILHKNAYDQVSVTSGGTTAFIVLGNITVGNGVIHMIDNLLGFTYNNVGEQIEKDPQLSQFHLLLEKVYIKKIEEAIGTKKEVTVFAPTNEAFLRIKDDDKKKLLHDTHFIEEIIKYHIIEDMAWNIAPITVDYNAKERKQCMQGSDLSVYNFQYDRYVQGGFVTAKIVRIDVGCTNGIIQYIDKILGLPDENIMSIIHGHPWLEKLPYTAYVVTELSDSLSGKIGGNNQYSYNLCPGKTCDYTVFVPNETAYQEMRINTQSQGLLKDTDIHRYFLKRMIIKNIKIYEQRLANGQMVIEAVNGNKILLEKYYNKIYLRYHDKVATVLQSDLGATNGVVHVVDKMLWTSDDTSRASSHSTRFINLAFIISILISLSVLLCQ